MAATAINETAALPAPAMSLQPIRVEDLIPSPFNKRRNMDKQRLADLGANMKEIGQRQNCVARPHPSIKGKYEMVAGHRRLAAAKLAGMATLSVHIDNLTDEMVASIISSENLHREDLSPMEEAEQLGVLIHDMKLTYQQAADKIRKPLVWVARRVSLLKLSPLWRAAVSGDTKPEFKSIQQIEAIAEWPAEHLELIARLPAATQDAILTQSLQWKLRERVTFKHLNEIVGDHMRAISSAKWKLDDATLLPAAGACTACPKRSSCQQELFSDFIATTDKKKKEKPENADRCLDPACWNQKSHLHTARVVKAAEQEHGKIVLVRDRSYIDHSDKQRSPLIAKSVSPYDVEKVKEGTPGAKLAIKIDGADAGSKFFVRTERPSSSNGRSSGKAAAAGGKIPLSERMAQLRKRRERRAVELFFEIDTVAIDTKKPKVWSGLLAWLAAFGTSEAGDKEGSYKPHSRNGGPLHIAIKDYTEAQLRRWIIKAVMRDFRDRCRGYEPEAEWRRVKNYCEILDIDAQQFINAATAEIKEPASWAAERATLKKQSNNKKKVAKKK